MLLNLQIDQQKARFIYDMASQKDDFNQKHAANSYEAIGKQLPLYRAGTDERPSFEINDNAGYTQSTR